MVLLHGGANGFGLDDYILVGLGVVMLGGALWGIWYTKRQEAKKAERHDDTS